MALKDIKTLVIILVAIVAIMLGIKSCSDNRDINRLNKDIIELEQDINTLNKAIKEKADTIEISKKEKKDLNLKNNILAFEISKLQNELKKCKDSNREKDNSITHLTKELEVSNFSNADLFNELDRCAKSLNNFMDLLDEAYLMQNTETKTDTVYIEVPIEKPQGLLLEAKSALPDLNTMKFYYGVGAVGDANFRPEDFQISVGLQDKGNRLYLLQKSVACDECTQITFLQPFKF
jgi:predicted RNase H-like nuclease (RuvC/YqgF family)